MYLEDVHTLDNDFLSLCVERICKCQRAMSIKTVTVFRIGKNSQAETSKCIDRPKNILVFNDLLRFAIEQLEPLHFTVSSFLHNSVFYTFEIQSTFLAVSQIKHIEVCFVLMAFYCNWFPFLSLVIEYFNLYSWF